MGKSIVEQETEPLCQKFNLIGNACTYLFGQIQQQGEKIASLETALQEKADSKSINEKIKKSKKKQKDKVKNEINYGENRQLIIICVRILIGQERFISNMWDIQ